LGYVDNVKGILLVASHYS